MNSPILPRNAIALIAERNRVTLLPDGEQWVNRIQVRSESSNRLYIVAQRKTTGEWSCGCPGWKAHRNCKHLKNMVPILIAAAKPAPGVR
jgi:hypothetical protein